MQTKISEQVANLEDKHNKVTQLTSEILLHLRENVNRGKIKTESTDGDIRLKSWIQVWEDRLKDYENELNRRAELLDDYIRDKQQMARLLGVQLHHDRMMDEIKRLQSQNIKLTNAACPECQGAGMVGDYGPGGIDRPDRRTGNSEAQPCDHSLANAQVCDPTKEDS